MGAQLYYIYSTMNAGKSIDVLKTYHNYKEQGKLALLFTSEKDNRFGFGKVASRIGVMEKAITFGDQTNLLEIVSHYANQQIKVSCVLVDEAQFLRKEQVSQLLDIVYDLHTPVMAYGLKADFRGELFEGSRELLAYAEKIKEMKTVCWFCESKANHNLRVINGFPVFAGEQIVIGNNADKTKKLDEVSYYPVCGGCFHAMRKSGGLLRLKDINKDDVDSLIWSTYDEFLSRHNTLQPI